MKYYQAIAFSLLIVGTLAAFNSANTGCWSLEFDYPCCKTTKEVVYTDDSGQWGIENDDWCGIVSDSSEDNEGPVGNEVSSSDDSDEGSSDEGKSDEGSSDEGKSDEDKSDEGKSDEGNSDEGKSDEGKSDEGESDEGKSDEGKSDEDKSDEGSEGSEKNPGYSKTVLPNGGIFETGVFIPQPSSHKQAEYPNKPNNGTDACSSKWHMQDGVCVAMYCEDDLMSENCDECGGVAGQGGCVAVDSKTGKSGIYPEVHDARNQEWHYTRSTHYGLTYAGACAFGVYGLCAIKADVTMESEICQTFCKNYPDLCEDREDSKYSLRGNFIAPNGNYYTQFWSSLPGDYDNYLSCGECYELEITKEDGSLYPEGEKRSDNIIAQIVDSCPCSANAKWCCGSGIDHCHEIDFKYGCPIPEGSVHFDLSDIAMTRLQTNDANTGMVEGVIPIRYKRVPCPVKGNIYIRVLPGANKWYFAINVVNVANMGSLVAVEVLRNGTWAALARDPNYSTTRPQERYGSWVVPPLKKGEQSIPFEVPLTFRFTDSAFNSLTAPEAIKDWPTSDDYFFYIDSGVQFPMPDE